MPKELPLPRSHPEQLARLQSHQLPPPLLTYNAEPLLGSGDADVDLVWIGHKPQVLLLPAFRGLPVNRRAGARANGGDDHVPPFAACKSEVATLLALFSWESHRGTLASAQSLHLQDRHSTGFLPQKQQPQPLALTGETFQHLESYASALVSHSEHERSGGSRSFQPGLFSPHTDRSTRFHLL